MPQPLGGTPWAPPRPQGPPTAPWGADPASRPPIDHPDGTAVLVLGVLSMVACGVLGPFAWSKGSRTIRQIDADPGRYANRSTVQTGRILGIIGTGFWLVTAVGALLVVVLAGATVTSSNSDSHIQACEIERRTLETAGDAYFAEKRVYPTRESQLVGPYLSEESENFDIQGGPASFLVVTAPDSDC